MLTHGFKATSRLYHSIACTNRRTTVDLVAYKGWSRWTWAETLQPGGHARTITTSSRPVSPIGLGRFRHAFASRSWRQRCKNSYIHSVAASSTSVESTRAQAGDISALPGPLNLFIPTSSQLLAVSDAQTLTKFVEDRRLLARRLLEDKSSLFKPLHARYASKVADIIREPSYVLSVVQDEPLETRSHLVGSALGELLRHHPRIFCRVVTALMPAHINATEKALQNATTIPVMQYLYYELLYEGLKTAHMAEEFYACLATGITHRGKSWSDRTLACLPMYHLRLRCPSAHREIIDSAYNAHLSTTHFENRLRQAQQAIFEGKTQTSIAVLQGLQRDSLVLRSVEFYNTFSVILDHVERHGSTELATWIASTMSSRTIANDKHLCSVLLQFAVRKKLRDAVDLINENVMSAQTPNITIITKLMRAKITLGMHDDQSDPFFTGDISDFAQEKSYALHISLRRMRLERLTRGYNFIYAELLEKLQEHMNVSFLVDLGIADDVESPHLPLIDAPIAGLMLWQYFAENQFRQSAVLPVYQNFKALLSSDSETAKMVCFPDGYVFNIFIAAFGRTSREHLEDALDVLAELTHNHDPVRNMPQNIPDAMKNPARLHAGPNGRTYCLLIYALIHYGQHQAAERCLAEIWKRWPDHWNKPCDALIKSYVHAGKNSRVAYLLKRKINAGFPMTSDAIQAVSNTNVNPKDARRHFLQRQKTKFAKLAKKIATTRTGSAG